MSLEIANEVKELEEVCGCGSWEHTSDLSVIRHDIWELKMTVTSLLETIEPISKEIGPAIDALADSPVGNMFGLGKKVENG